VPDLIAIDTTAVPWEARYNEHVGQVFHRKDLVEDPETHVTVRMVRYGAGVTNTWHTHPCAHGMFVLEGTLVTHAGSFGPGSFVWFPEGMVMQHGATADRDVVVLFITNKPFDIHYQDRPGEGIGGAPG
jgi:quercetin dioxygenase-like cupin family protein